MSGENQVMMLAGLEPKVLQEGDKGVAQLVVEPHTGALLVTGNVTVGDSTGSPSGSSVVSCVTGSDVQVLAANVSRKGFSVQNLSSTNGLSMNAGSFSVYIPPEGLYENHPSMVFTGAVSVNGITGGMAAAFELV